MYVRPGTSSIWKCFPNLALVLGTTLYVPAGMQLFCTTLSNQGNSNVLHVYTTLQSSSNNRRSPKVCLASDLPLINSAFIFFIVFWTTKKDVIHRQQLRSNRSPQINQRLRGYQKTCSKCYR